jgi:hypothetical protein
VKHERCIGTLHGPAGDCLRPVTVGLFCYGYLVEDEDGLLAPSSEGITAHLRPLLFPVCAVHRAAVAQWAEHLWGQIAEAFWVPPAGFELLKRECAMERDPLVMNPNPARAIAAAA